VGEEEGEGKKDWGEASFLEFQILPLITLQVSTQQTEMHQSPAAAKAWQA
jgi:hypothetical protein